MDNKANNMTSDIRQPSSKAYTKGDDVVGNLDTPMSPLLPLQKLWMHNSQTVDRPNRDASRLNERIYNPPSGDRPNERIYNPPSGDRPNEGIYNPPSGDRPNERIYNPPSGDRPNERIYNPPSGDRTNVDVSCPKENRVSDENREIKQTDPEEERFSGNIQKFRKLTSLDDIRSLRLWKAVIAEFVGTLILVLVGCGSCIQDWSSDGSVILRFNDTEEPLPKNFSTTDIVQIALAFGLSVANVVWIIGHVSGGHINPAVTCAMVITRNVSLARGILYIVGQLLGATAGAGILMSVTPKERQGTLGCTLLGQGVNDVMGVCLEFCITFVLILTVFAACDKRRKDLGGSFPLTIGLSVTMCHLFAVRFTGSSMNTARSFGPAVVMGIWTDHWIYWIGPIFGGMLAGLMYDNVFAVNASVMKCRAFLLSSDYENERHPSGKLRFRVLEEDDELLNLEKTSASHGETGKNIA